MRFNVCSKDECNSNQPYYEAFMSEHRKLNEKKGKNSLARAIQEKTMCFDYVKKHYTHKRNRRVEIEIYTLI